MNTYIDVESLFLHTKRHTGRFTFRYTNPPPHTHFHPLKLHVGAYWCSIDIMGPFRKSFQMSMFSYNRSFSIQLHRYKIISCLSWL